MIHGAFKKIDLLVLKGLLFPNFNISVIWKLDSFQVGEIQPIDVIITRLNSLFIFTGTSKCWGKCYNT